MNNLQAPWVGMCGEDYYHRHDKPDPSDYEEYNPDEDEREDIEK